MKKIFSNSEISLYLLEEKNKFKSFISSTPETRKICNDSLIAGVEYTNLLKKACSKTFKILSDLNLIKANESKTQVINLLRGGLNFSLRDALHEALNWNWHDSGFLSAQRVQQPDTSWTITESSYKKIHLKPKTQIVTGDVVATGTSCSYCLDEVLKIASTQKSFIEQLTFFTIGGENTSKIIKSLLDNSKNNTLLGQASVIYFEGCFGVPNNKTQLSIKLEGTDLIRKDGIFSPEFISSQSENPCYPIERCSIYDAGSRSFNLVEYLEDVLDYWKKVLSLAENGMSYQSYLKERMPEYESKLTESANLLEVCHLQIQKLKNILTSIQSEQS